MEKIMFLTNMAQQYTTMNQAKDKKSSEFMQKLYMEIEGELEGRSDDNE